jgi:single-strand DNA-binding protein
MAKSMAVICLTGNLTKDAEIQTTASGQQLLKFSLAVNTGYGDGARCTFYNCSYWSDRGENLLQYMRKGDKIGTTGEPSLREFSTDSGKRQSLDVNVREIILLGSKRDAAPADDADDSPLPF